MDDKNIYVEIMDGEKLTYFHRTDLYKMGYRFRKKDKVWFQIVPNRSLVEIAQNYCKLNSLICIVYTKNSLRDNHYRDNYFNNNRPLFKDYYICAYCMKPIHQDQITIDHIISVRKAKYNTFYKKILEKLKIDNVNDEKNLAAACKSCNSRKGSKGGLWVIRGFLGKHYPWIILCYMLGLILLIFLLYIIITVN
ncbi:MAG: HNH endonuclease [Erysipelotrichaceae bacterium]|nr:HNH endonuclease [Erysipelotrichaceae bacterium]